jgi:hypothetical protein
LIALTQVDFTGSAAETAQILRMTVAAYPVFACGLFSLKCTVKRKEYFYMTILVLLSLLVPVPAAESEFRLENGLRVILISQPGHPVAVVALGVHAGVYTDPEGRCGLSHLTEHIFWYGASKSYQPYRAFETLVRDGPLGIGFQDVNAETLQNLTYFYAARPSGSVELALEVFSEKLSGVTATAELLDTERKKVLAEIEQATAVANKNPAIQRMVERDHRYPKAGIASHVHSPKLEHVEAYQKLHYRPDRIVLLVQGAIDSNKLRKRIEDLFGPIRAREGNMVPDGPLQDMPQQCIADYPCAGADARERTALRIAGAVWQDELRKHGRGYVEWDPRGALRAVLFGGDAAPLHKLREILQEPLTETVFQQAVAGAGEKAKAYNRFIVSYGNPQKANDLKACTRIMLQAAIDRLRFEAEGGQEYLELLEKTTPKDVAEVAKKYLTADAAQVRHLPPRSP